MRSRTARTRALRCCALALFASLGGAGCEGGGPSDDVPRVNTGGDLPPLVFESGVQPSSGNVGGAGSVAAGQGGVIGVAGTGIPGTAGFAGGAGIPSNVGGGAGGAGAPGTAGLGSAGTAAGIGGFGGGGIGGDAFDGSGFAATGFGVAGAAGTTAANRPPIAAFVLQPQCLGLADVQNQVTLVSTSTDPDGDVLACLWTMPAGIPSDADACVVSGVSFLTANESPITLTVRDRRGGVATLTREFGPCANLAAGQAAQAP